MNAAARPAASGLGETFNDLIARSSLRWKDCDGAPESTLLRLALLREIARELHRNISSHLARGERAHAKDLRARSEAVEELRTRPKLTGDLESALAGHAVKKAASSRTLPEGLFKRIEREKLERYDRQWEAAITSEACALGWKIWTLDAQVEIAEIENWGNRLADSLWPRGVILFVEAADPVAELAERWKGRWILVLHDALTDPAREIGVGGSHHRDLKWKLVYSP